jgi:hypothetical protein
MRDPFWAVGATAPMRTRLLALSSFLLLVGCSSPDRLAHSVPAADQALAMHYVELLRTRSFDDIDRATVPSARGPRLYAALLKMTETLPERAPTSSKLVSAQVTAEQDGTKMNLVYEYDFDGQWVLANVALLRKPDAVLLAGLGVRAIPESLEEYHRLTFAGKSPLHFVVFALAVALPLLTLYALVACIRTRMSWTKWLWVVFIAIGLGRFSINWTTGESQLALLALQPFSASATAALFSPWVMSVSLPLGALVFLARRWWRNRRPAALRA